MPKQSIQIKGLDKLRKAFNKFPVMIAQHMSHAGKMVGIEVLKTRGLGGGGKNTYPGQTGANAPPTPYYKRGVGTQYKSFNAGNSERYGTKWTVKSVGYRTTIGNVASYAPYLGGEGQSRHMKKIGWVKLTDAVTKKLPQIRRIYQLWVNKALRKAGL